MTRMTVRSLLGVAALTIGTQATQAQSPVDQKGQTMNHSEIQAAISANNAAVAARDIAAILATYEPGAVLVAQPGLPVAGTDALRAGFAQFLALDPDLTVTGHEIITAGDIALHLYPWRMRGRAPDGTAIEQAGLSVVVLRRQPDGRWLMVIDNPFGGRLLDGN